MPHQVPAGEVLTVKAISIHRFSGVWALYGSCLLWNLSNGMLFVLTPLYGVTLGFSLLEIGTLVSLPYMGTIVIRFVGGAISDRFGEHWMLQACYVLNCLAAFALALATGFFSLLLSTALANLSRSTFWVPAQSLASQVSPRNPGRTLGRLSAANYTGQLLGLSLAGVFAGLLGYRVSFLLLNVLMLLCLLVGFLVPLVRTKPRGRELWQITLGMAKRLARKQTWLVISSSAAAAVPFSLTQSVYPVYMTELEFPEQWIGVAVAARSVGPVFTGLLLGSLITMRRQRLLYGLGMAGLGLFTLGSVFAQQVTLVGLCIAGLGMAGAVMDLLNQVQAVDLSRAADRSAVMASTGLGWNLSPMVLPIIVGWLAETYGYELAFVTGGVFFFLVAAGTGIWYRLLS